MVSESDRLSHRVSSGYVLARYKYPHVRGPEFILIFFFVFDFFALAVFIFISHIDIIAGPEGAYESSV